LVITVALLSPRESGHRAGPIIGAKRLNVRGAARSNIDLRQGRPAPLPPRRLKSRRFDLAQGARPRLRLEFAATGFLRDGPMTSDKLLRDLRDIDWLIAVLSAQPGAAGEDLEDLRWLRERRRFLATLLRTRRAQKGKKIVSLALWRSGRDAPRQRRVA
jgi:hypothetical protein